MSLTLRGRCTRSSGTGGDRGRRLIAADGRVYPSTNRSLAAADSLKVVVRTAGAIDARTRVVSTA